MKIIPTIILWLTYSGSFAQGKYDANWCFGIKAGINFSDTANPKSFNTLCNNDEAAASISDSLGNLLFYIAPDTPFNINNNEDYPYNAIYNKYNNVINKGDSLYVSYGLNGAVFLPVPETNNSYYVFYLTWGYFMGGYGTLQYSQIVFSDTSYQVTKKNIIVTNSLFEWSLVAVKHANGSDWWLLLHEADSSSSTNHFFEFLITKDSIIGPYIQSIGSMHSTIDVVLGELKFSKSGNWLASCLGDQNGVDLFNFDRCSGQLYNYISLNNIDSLHDGVIVDGEFSEDESKLFVSEGQGQPQRSGIYQYDLVSNNINSSKLTLYKTDSSQTSFGDLCIAPDNKIYLAVEYTGAVPYINNAYNQFNSYLWVINDPDSLGSACKFQPYGYYLGDTLNDSARVYFALPNMPNYNLGALSIYQAGASVDTTMCNGDSITIGFPAISGVLYQWQPAPGITDVTHAQQTVKPDTSTWYYITFTDSTIQYSCQSRTDSVYVQVVICCDSALLAQCTLSKDTFICTDIDTPTKGANLKVDTVPGVSFVWLPGFDISGTHDTLQIVDPVQSTWYYVLFYSDSDSSAACNKRLDSVYVKLEKCDTMGIQEINNATQHLSIYPNPAQSIIIVEWQPTAALEATVMIYDILGREVSSQQVSSGSAQINVSGLEDGLYVVRVLSPSGGGVGGGILGSAKLAVIK